MESIKLKNEKYWDATGVYDHTKQKKQDELNEEFDKAIQNTITVSDTEPTDPNVKLWMYQNPGQKIEIPTMEDFHNLKPATDEQVSAAVSDWLEENISGGETIAIDKSLTVEGAAADAKVVGDLKSALTVTKTGNPDEFTNKYLNGSGSEVTSPFTALTKRYYNYMQDGLLSVEVAEPYCFYAYGWERATHIGSLHADGTFSTKGTALLLNKINLADYPDITFKFALCHMVNNSPVAVTLDDAVKFNFTFRNNADLSHRRISVMGDSISSFTGYTTTGSPDAYYPLESAKVYHVQNMYWKCLADRNGMIIDTIDAYAGSTVGDKWQTDVRIPFIDDSRINSLGTPDVIIVEGGINDFGGNPLGEYPALGDYTKTYEFRTAYSLLLNKLKTKYTKATIICLSMLSPRTYNNTTFPEKQTEVKQALATDTTPHAFAEFNESIEHIAKQYQCAYCDITDLQNYYLNPSSSLGPHWYFYLHLEVAYRIEQLLKQIYA